MTNRYKGILLLILLASILTGLTLQQELYFTDSGHVEFTSDAPLELIQAASDELAGILNTVDHSFSFTIPMISFQGFNSALQQTHFNENYMESEKYPNSTFSGKIIEDIDFFSVGTASIRAKGKLIVHGIEMDRIIRCTIKVEADRIIVNADFIVLLEDHEINIPSIVQQKIAKQIEVSIQVEMKLMVQ